MRHYLHTPLLRWPLLSLFRHYAIFFITRITLFAAMPMLMGPAAPADATIFSRQAAIAHVTT